MKKIAIFTSNLKVGGIQKSIVNLLKNLDYKKYQVDLYLFDKDNFYELPSEKNVNIIYLNEPNKIYKFLPFNLVNKIMKVNFLEKEYDVSIDFDSYQMHTAIGALNCNSKKKVIWIHNDIPIKLKEELKYRILHFFFKNKYKYFDTYCAVSKGALESFKKMNSFNEKKYMVIPNYIDTLEIKKKIMEECDIKLDKEKLNIVSVGRLCHQKGFDIMINNIKELTSYRQDFHLYIIGDGEDRDKLTTQIKDLNLNDYITLLGNQKNPFKYLKKMDLFYLQSRYEGQGMVILEAKASGLDILIPKHLEKYCDNVKGSTDIIHDLKYYKKEKNHGFNDLKEYNKSITRQIDKLLNE